jgi:hypothetical protein
MESPGLILLLIAAFIISLLLFRGILEIFLGRKGKNRSIWLWVIAIFIDITLWIWGIFELYDAMVYAKN